MDDYDEEAELVAEQELFGEDAPADEELFGEDAPDAPAGHHNALSQARHEAHVRGQIWGSDAGDCSDGMSDGGASNGGASNAFAANGATEMYFGREDPVGNNHWHQSAHGRPGSHSNRDDSEAGDGPREEGGGPAYQHHILPSQCHVRSMPGFEELDGLSLLGHGVNMKPMIFDHTAATTAGWVRYDLAGVDNSAPVRAMVVNVPAVCFGNDATKFKDWQTPMNNSLRAASIAALLGLIMTPLSKGFVSGAHEEEARAAAQEGEDGESEKRRVRDVRWYQMQSEEDPATNIPMVVIGYEDLYNSTKCTVQAIRIWLFVFDKTHSTSDLARKLMMESAQEAAHSGSAHCQNSLRKTTAVQHAKQSRGLLGASLATAHLELVAGMCYRHIPNVSVYKDLLWHYGGKTGDKPGRQPVDLTPDPENPNKFPRGMLNAPMLPAEELGCTHPLAIEWVFNAKRPEALRAGLVDLEGQPLDIHPDQLDVNSYFTMSPVVPDQPPRRDTFTVPGWVGSDQGVGGKGCFFLQTDPYKLNIFDMVLPHAIAGSIKPGPELMRLFKERFEPNSSLAESSPEMLNLFDNKMTGRDQWIQDQVASMTDTIVSFDTFDCSSDERQSAIDVQKAAKRGIAHYGQMDGEDHVIEPRQVLKEHAYATNNVHDKLVSSWASEQRAEFAAKENLLRVANDYEHAKTPITDPVFEELMQARAAFEERHQRIMKEVIMLNIAKMERSFNSKMDKESIPAGYRAVWDGLQKELDDMPDRTANIAFGGMGVDKSGKCGVQLSDSDRTVFGHLQNWLGSFFEDDCFIDGRDWRLMQEFFYHCFEQFGEQTLLLIFCGPKGNGKTLRTERAMAAFVKGWITMSGPSSAKAGMQGNSDSSNGSNCVYDEMIDELTDGDGSNRTEYWKMILMKREYVYNKSIVVKGADGREMHKTFKLKTPHQETHAVCTNRGPAFTKGKEDPTEVKSALIDRAVVQFVRTLGSKTHDDQEFEKNLMNPEVKCKMRAFRILTCLMGLLKMLIFRQPYLKPDLALAQKLFDEWDNMLDCKYNLPRPSPRKNIKRLENLITMCCQNAVAHVFFYKQTAHMFEAGRTTAEYPKGKPFELSMLYECVQLLQPTREMIHQAWCMGLEYSIGTSSMGLNTLTVAAEITGLKVGDWFANLPEKPFQQYLQEESSLIDLQVIHETEQQQQQQQNGAPTAVARPRKNMDPNKMTLPAFEKIFNHPDDTMTEEQVRRMKKSLESRREARVQYQHHCSTSEVQNQMLRDSQQTVDDCIGNSLESKYAGLEGMQATAVGGGSAESPMDVDLESPDLDRPREEGEEEAGEEEDEDSLEAQGRRLWTEQRKHPGALSPSQGRKIFNAYHKARAVDCPGSANCCISHVPTVEEMENCPYCSSELIEDAAAEAANEAAADAEWGESTVAAAGGPTYLSLASSLVWPDLLEAGMFYKAQTLVQWAGGHSAFIDPAGCPAAGTAPRGIVNYKKQKNGIGAQRLDMGWLQTEGEQFKTWQTTASYIHSRGSTTVKEFDFHPDGLRDCLYMCSTPDNSRRCPEDPFLPSDRQVNRNLQSNDNKAVGDSTVVVKPAPYKLPGQDKMCSRTHKHLPRDPRSHVQDSDFQRRLDSMLHAGRLSALGILTSNKVTNSPPIRMHQDGIELNRGALHAHIMLVVESVLACALTPGLRNMQEKLCNRQAGPAGLSAPRKEEKVAVGKKRTEDDTRAKDNSKLIHTLPYSYDVVGLALGMDMGKMLYDDVGEKAAEGYTLAHKARLGLDIQFANLPHLSTRFIGYSEDNRQTVSIKLDAERPAGQDYVEAGDPGPSESAVSKQHVYRSLGRNPTDSDMARFISRRQGARSMGGVRGDIFAHSTWRKHTVTTLKNRGLIRGGLNDVIVKCFFDMEHLIQARVAESASAKKVSQKFEKMELDLAAPGTYAALESESSAKRVAVDSAVVETQIHHLGYTADALPSIEFDDDDSPVRPEARRDRHCISMGSGPIPDQ